MRLFCLCSLFPLWLAAATPVGWGVISAYETPAYDKTGAEVSTLKGGTRFDILKEITANKAPAYYVELPEAKAKRCVITAADAKAFLEFPAEGDAEGLAGIRMLQKALSEYYTTLAMRQAMVERAREQHLAKSPAKQLEKLRKELATIPAKDRAAEAAQAKAKSNAERLKYQDIRKELRFRATGLQQEIKRQEAVADSWLAAHPFDEKPIRNKPVWKRLTQRLREMEAVLAPYGVTPAAD